MAPLLAKRLCASHAPRHDLYSSGRHEEVFHSSGAVPDGVRALPKVPDPNGYGAPLAGALWMVSHRFTLDRVSCVLEARLATRTSRTRDAGSVNAGEIGRIDLRGGLGSIGVGPRASVDRGRCTPGGGR